MKRRFIVHPPLFVFALIVASLIFAGSYARTAAQGPQDSSQRTGGAQTGGQGGGAQQSGQQGGQGTRPGTQGAPAAHQNQPPATQAGQQGAQGQAGQTPSRPTTTQQRGNNPPAGGGGGRTGAGQSGEDPSPADDPNAGREAGGTNTRTNGGTTNTNRITHDEDAPEGWGAWILSKLLWILGGLLVLAALAFLAYGIKLFIDGNRRRMDGHFAGIKKRQEEQARLTKEALAGLSKEMNGRIAELQAELRDLRRSVQEDNRVIIDNVRRAGSSAAPAASYAGGYGGGYAPSAARVDEPTFPVQAEEFLSRAKRNGVVVKPDFQNGMLVQDSDNDGEFLLVRDQSVPDGLLYVVPRVGYFQTKQDFYNYYDKYYDCQRPSAGTVWIVAPAVVEKVGGGWRLSEKGELEVK